MGGETVGTPASNGKMSEVNVAFGMRQLKHTVVVHQRHAEVVGIHLEACVVVGALSLGMEKWLSFGVHASNTSNRFKERKFHPC